ncbi:uncharacterized protein LOC112185008 [Rosa chinensis]|uniref:uncharacterized protein LOC112185008 n=1 Tax=Rosa chinensis TaxID=74649 RepID=UPI001AD8C147|nr:uncharacterized protein LOC112185008 [Rosa chinensis]
MLVCFLILFLTQFFFFFWDMYRVKWSGSESLLIHSFGAVRQAKAKLELCAKVLRAEDLELLEKSVFITLCKLEKVFPPAFKFHVSKAIECWRKFHVSKAKEGKEEHWKSDKAKEIYDDLTERKNRVEEVFGEADDWEIYQKVIGGPSHGRVLGLGAGVKLKDYNSPNQTCNKPTCLEQKEDYERVKGQVESLTDKLDKLTQIVQSLLPNTSDNSKARNSHSVDNIATDSSAHHDEDGTDEDGDKDVADEYDANSS